MSLETIFYISQSVASVAVVGSLIYLALQVRSAERSQRAIMQQGRADRASQGAISIANPELARVFYKGTAGKTELTREEFTQWMMICRALFLSGEDSFLQYKAGQLDQMAFDSYLAGVRFYMASPGMRAAWRPCIPSSVRRAWVDRRGRETRESPCAAPPASSARRP